MEARGEADRPHPVKDPCIEEQPVNSSTVFYLMCIPKVLHLPGCTDPRGDILSAEKIPHARVVWPTERNYVGLNSGAPQGDGIDETMG